MLNMGLPASCYAVTPHDTTDNSFAGLYVSGAGTVTIEPEGRPGEFVQWVVPAGGYVLCRCTRVRATGTAATGIIGLR